MSCAQRSSRCFGALPPRLKWGRAGVGSGQLLFARSNRPEDPLRRPLLGASWGDRGIGAHPPLSSFRSFLTRCVSFSQRHGSYNSLFRPPNIMSSPPVSLDAAPEAGSNDSSGLVSWPTPGLRFSGSRKAAEPAGIHPGSDSFEVEGGLPEGLVGGTYDLGDIGSPCPASRPAGEPPQGPSVRVASPQTEDRPERGGPAGGDVPGAGAHHEIWSSNSYGASGSLERGGNTEAGLVSHPVSGTVPGLLARHMVQD